MILFLLPFLGGRSTYFEKFIKQIKNVTVIGLDFKQGGESFQECLQYFQNFIEDNIQGEKFSLWGHSIGAVYAYELGRIWKDNQNLHCIFLSGRTSPKYDFTPKENIIMDKEEFRIHVQKRYGYSDHMMDSRIGKLITYELQRGYQIHRPCCCKHEKLDKKFIVLYATDDELCKDIKSWNEYSNQQVIYFKFTGGHFFIMKYVDKICNIIEGML